MKKVCKKGTGNTSLPVPFFMIIFLGLAPLVRAESLFEEKKKDAASSVVIDVEDDRSITATENRKFVQSQPDYVKIKLKEFDKKLAIMNERIEKLEAEIKDLTAKKQ